jgi:hypothetical protein
LIHRKSVDVLPEELERVAASLHRRFTLGGLGGFQEVAAQGVVLQAIIDD